MKQYSRDKERIIGTYNQRISKYGATVRGLASGTKERQFLRFRMLLDVGILEGKSILDLGCGFGGLLDYLNELGLNVEYEGWDINPTIIESARQQHPDNKFVCKDILNDPDWDAKQFDFVISSSSFNNKLIDWDNYEFIQAILKRSYSIAREAVAINLQTDYVDFKREGVFYYSPERLFRLSKAITKRVALKHDYPLYDFAVFLYKDFEPWGNPDV